MTQEKPAGGSGPRAHETVTPGAGTGDTPVVPEVPGAAKKMAGFLTGRPVERPHVEHVEAVSEADHVRWKGYVERPAAGRLGVACSGGGIRSATYNLGALQELRKGGLLAGPERGGASYLAAISGGSYMAVAHTVTAGLTEDHSLFTDQLPPWAPGSPEETHLRTNSTYLAPGLPGKIWFATQVVYGVACNLVPIALLLWIVATVTGWFYAAGLQPGIADATVTVDAARLAWVLVPLAAGVVALVTRRVLDRVRVPPGSLMAWLKAWSPRLILAGLGAGVIVFVLPGLLVAALAGAAWVRVWLDGTEVSIGALIAAGEATGALLVAAAVYRAIRGLGQRLLAVVARLVGPLLVAAPVLYWAKQAAVTGFQGWTSLASPWLLLGLSALLVVSIAGHNVRWSLHPLYREQLSTAYVLRRERTADGLTAVEPPYEQPVLFSKLRMPGPDNPGHMPELIVCAAVNVSDRVLPPGRGADTFTFTAKESGSPLTGYAPTSFYEGGAGVSVVTLPAMMAISGAAISPSMGKMTLPSVRLLLALFNVRLGVWVPNPLPGFRQRHERRRARIGIGARLLRGWKEPGLLYVIYEALGLNSLDREFLYVSDGGHWENLGLVELLRRGCTEIVCFDASGDKLDTFETIAAAMALARSELRVTIDLDLTDLQVDPDTGTSPRDHVVARFRYPDGTPGTLVLAKAAIAADAPWDLHAYRKRDPRFPCHSTGDQFFDDVQFESYRALGAHAGRGAAATLLAERQRLAAERPAAGTDPPGRPAAQRDSTTTEA